MSLSEVDSGHPPPPSRFRAAAGGALPRMERGFARLARLTDRWGLREHLEIRGSATPGYRTSDAARALVLVLHDYAGPPRVASTAATTYLAFLEQAVRQDGLAYGWLSPNRHWTDQPEGTESWGRSVAALGTAARMGRTQAARDRAVKAFLRAAKVRSADARASALAALGAVALVRSRTDASGAARSLLADCLEVIPRRAGSGWASPAATLTHTNATLCDALIVGGAALGRSTSVRQGLSMLSTLMDTGTRKHGHLSPAGDPGGTFEGGPRARQRPADVAAIADACAHAFAITGDLHWRRGVWLAWNWFLGLNDLGVQVYDPDTGAANDELLPVTRASAVGTEATLAALSTLQRARAVGA